MAGGQVPRLVVVSTSPVPAPDPGPGHGPDPELQRGPAPTHDEVEPPILTSARQAVLRVLRHQHAPMTVDETAHACGLHPNTVRTHLDALVDVGFALRSRAPITGRGRPAWRYEATLAGSDAGAEYAALAVALADQVATLPDPRGLARAAGLAWGRSLEPPAPMPAARTREEQVRETVSRGLERMGFAPEDEAQGEATPEDESGDGSRPDGLVLRQCPMLDAARRVPHVVCTVHEGLAQALVESAGGDPDQVVVQPFALPGGCRVTLSGRPSPPPESR